MNLESCSVEAFARHAPGEEWRASFAQVQVEGLNWVNSFLHRSSRRLWQNSASPKFS